MFKWMNKTDQINCMQTLYLPSIVLFFHFILKENELNAIVNFWDCFPVTAFREKMIFDLKHYKSIKF